LWNGLRRLKFGFLPLRHILGGESTIRPKDFSKNRLSRSSTAGGDFCRHPKRDV